MSPLVFVTIVVVGAAVAVPAARASHASTGGDGPEATGRRDTRVQISVSKVECPASRADVIMTAPRDHDTVEYSIYRGNSLVRTGLLWPGVQRSVPVYVDPGATERVAVRLAGQGTTSYQVRSRCDDDDGSKEQSYGEYRESVYSESESESDSDSEERGGSVIRHHRYNPLIRTSPEHLSSTGRLPYTGPPADFYGKVATAVGLVVFGGMLLWIGMIWPHRTPAEPLLRPRSPYGRRRYPDSPTHP